MFAKDEAGVTEHMKYISDQADRLGVSLIGATREFTKFSIAMNGKLDQKTSRNLFEGVSEYAAVLQIDQQQYERAFRAIQQMNSKGQLMAEEIRGQLAESLYGSTAVLVKAAGFGKDEGAFFKAVEKGQIKATPELMNNFANGLKEIANQNGALEAVTKKTRAEMNRFFSELTRAKDTIFGSGMDEGLSYMFKTFSDVLKDMKPSLEFFGGWLKGTLIVISESLRIATSPIREFANLLGNVFGSDGATVLGMISGGYMITRVITGIAAAVPPLVRALRVLTLAWSLSPMGLITRIAQIGLGVGSLYAINSAFDSIEGKTSYSSSPSGNRIQSSQQKVNVNVNFNSEEAKRFVKVEIDNNKSSEFSRIQSSMA